MKDEHLEERIRAFEDKYVPEPNSGCWLWIGAGKRYGNFFCDGLQVSAHRFSYMIHKGDITDENEIDHRCHTTICVNPNHLQSVTKKRNLELRARVRNQYVSATQCKNGHEFDELNTKIDSRGQRVCRACARQRSQDYKRRKTDEHQ